MPSLHSAGVLLVTLAVVLASVVWVKTTNARVKVHTDLEPKLAGSPLETPGPIAASVCRNLNLSGLTVIPLVHLPPIKISLPLPFSETRRLKIVVSSTASEVVFSTLDVAELQHTALDVGRKPMRVSLSGITADFRGLFGVKVVVSVADMSSKFSADKASKANGSAANGHAPAAPAASRVFKWTGSGRVDMRLENSGMELVVQFVQGARLGDTAKLEVLSSKVDEGDIERAKLEGYGVWGAIGTWIIPYVRGTTFVKWPVKLLSDYLTREIIERGVVSDVIGSAWKPTQKHLDVGTWGAILDDERVQETAKPVEPPSLPSTRPPSPTKVKTDLTPPPVISSAFRFKASLIGPTVLQHFPLPDYSPPLYRPGGTRAALQSFNPLTSEVRLEITNSSFSKITFNRSSVAFDPSRPGGGDLVVTVEDFTVVLSSRFSVHADTSNLVAWSTGIKRIGEQGTANTTVKARSLEIRFVLFRNQARAEKEGHAPFELKDSSMSPFNTAEPVIELDRAFLKVGADLVNAVTSGLKVQIAQAASLLVKRGMSNAVRGYLQKAIDGLEEKLREAGVELPTDLRSAQPGHESMVAQ